MFQLSKQAKSVLVLAAGAVPIHAADTTVSGNLTVGTTAGAVGTAQLTIGGASPTANRLTYGTDGTGWKFAIGKNQGGTITDQFTITDGGNVGVGTISPGTAFTVGAGVLGALPDGAGAGFVPQLYNSQTSGVAGIGTMVGNGTNNRRLGLFVDQTNGVQGISSAYSSGSIPFVYRDGSTERLRIDTSGNVGIGTPIPGSKLAIEGSGEQAISVSSIGSGARRYGMLVNPSWASGSFSIYDHTSDTARLTVAANGRIGIGVINPVAKLEVNDGNGTGVIAYFGSSGINDAKGLYFSRPTVNTNPVNIQGTQFNVGAANIAMQAEGGNVGVGTTAPASKLDVNGADGTTNLQVFGDANIGKGSTNAALRVTSSAGTVPRLYLNGAGVTNDQTGIFGNVGSSSNLRFNTSGSTRVTIDSSGNVGIGEPIPSTKLHVAGNVKADSVAMTGTSHVTGTILVAPQGDLPMGSFTGGTVPAVP